MHYDEGRIYIGGGDLARNTVPGYNGQSVKLWSFGANADFVEELIVKDEEVSSFREYDGKLFVCPADPTTYPHGNLYIKESKTWTRKDIPDLHKARDLALFNGEIYIFKQPYGNESLGQDFLKSPDMGQSWVKLITELEARYNNIFWQMVPVEDFLLIMGLNEGSSSVFKYSRGNLEKQDIPILPPWEWGNITKLIGFKDGVLYKRGYEYSEQASLYSLRDFQNGATNIDYFNGDNIRDIVIRGKICYILTSSFSGDENFKGIIYSSADLKNWTKLAEFFVPAMPFSFEIMDNSFYVGLGNRNRLDGFADFESGSIYRIEPKVPMPDETGNSIKGDANRDGTIRSDDAILILQIAVGMLSPDSYHIWAADMDNDGEIKVNDAIIILNGLVALSAPGRQEEDSHENTSDHIVSIILESPRQTAEGDLEVSLKMNNANILGGGQICISYDTEALYVVDVYSSQSVLASNFKELGKVQIGFANAGNPDNNTIATINFRMLTDSLPSLKIQSAELFSPNGTKLDIYDINSEFQPIAIKHDALLQNFPNPFNPETWIPYQLKKDSQVRIKIFSIAGYLIRELELGDKSAGIYTDKKKAAYWDGKNKNGESVASGIYFYHFITKGFSAIRKMIIR